MVFLDFLDFLDFLETSEVAGPGPNPREIDISFGADGPLACARPDPTIGCTDVLPCVFVCVWGRYPPAAALLVRRLVVPVLNKLLQLPLHPLAGAWRVRVVCVSSVPPLLVVVGYWRFGAVPRAVPVVWNSIHVLQHWLHMTLVVATIFYSTRHRYDVSRIVLRDR